MNERIKQLAEQAGFYVDNGKIYIPSTSEEITTCQKKFAELIVQECIGLCKDFRSTAAREFCELLREDIQEHFGLEVEE
jgi:hypothetical protein